MFFRNSKCLVCGTPLGYDPESGEMVSLMHGPEVGVWQRWQAAIASDEPPADEASPPSLEDIPGQEQHAADPQQPMQQQQQTQYQQQQQQFQQHPALDAAPADLTAPQASDVSPAPSPDSRPKPTSPASPTTLPHQGGPLYKRCLNLSTPASCNWLVAADDPQDMCRACRLNRTIPDLTDASMPDNGYLWGLVELAKRRLVSALIILKLPVKSRRTEDPQRGLVFDFLRSPVNGPHVMTGHNTGLITLNVDEADDAKREAVRKAMREPYRTLVGHFRHEVGHYYWDRLIRGTPWMEGFHELFGDETTNYAASLKKNYEEGPPSDWPLHYVSAYASTHPWEDWAECWAHYLHMRDAIDTAMSFGLSVDRFDLEFTPFTIDALYQPDHPDAEQFLGFLNHWTRLTTMLNEMSRSMGQQDFYPFVLSHDVVSKLHFIHRVVTSESWLDEPPPGAENAVVDTSPSAMAAPAMDPAPVQQDMAPPPLQSMAPPPAAPADGASGFVQNTGITRVPG